MSILKLHPPGLGSEERITVPVAQRASHCVTVAGTHALTDATTDHAEIKCSCHIDANTNHDSHLSTLSDKVVYRASSPLDIHKTLASFHLIVF